MRFAVKVPLAVQQGVGCSGSAGKITHNTCLLVCSFSWQFQAVWTQVGVVL